MIIIIFYVIRFLDIYEDESTEESAGYNEVEMVKKLKLHLGAYLAGYIAYQLILHGPKSQQKKRTAALVDNEHDRVDEETLFFVRLKNRGGLKVPSQSTVQLVQAAEEVFVTGIEEPAYETKVLQTTSEELEKLGEMAFKEISHLIPVMFRGLDAALETKQELAKVVIRRHLKMRLLYFTRLFNSMIREISNRNRLTKTNQFKNN